MKILNNKFAKWIPLIILCASGLIAAGKISSTQSALVKEINNKLNVKFYDREQIYFRRELDRIQGQLDRMEKKLDAINANFEANPE